MKKTILISTVISCFFLNPALSQEQGKSSFRRNQVGIQLNPYLDKNLFNGLMHPMYGIRYGYKIKEPLLLGVESSGFFSYFFRHSDHIPYYIIRPGIFARYSIPSGKRLQGFLEVSPYMSHFYAKHTSSFDNSDLTINKFGFYFAPGATLYTKNKRFSFDFYYKISNLNVINNNKSVFSYKINYHF